MPGALAGDAASAAAPATNAFGIAILPAPGALIPRSAPCTALFICALAGMPPGGTTAELNQFDIAVAHASAIAGSSGGGSVKRSTRSDFRVETSASGKSSPYLVLPTLLFISTISSRRVCNLSFFMVSLRFCGIVVEKGFGLTGGPEGPTPVG